MPIEQPPTHQQIDRDLADLSDATLERLAAVEVRTGVTWSGLTDAERESQRASNMLSKRAFEARRKAEEAAKVADVQAQHAAALDAYRAQARKAFPGNDEAFGRLWPSLRDEWLLAQTRKNLGAVERELAAKRATY